MNKIKKAPIELINELDIAAKRWGHALLLVGFATGSKVVFSEFPERLQLLEWLLRQGGVPVGIFSVQIIDGKGHFFYRVLDESAGDEWSAPYMEAFLAKV